MTAQKTISKKRNFFRGFTLIELLIVITIIGILATFVVASFTSAQAKARDSKRKSDIDAIKKALELAKSDSNGGAFYPGISGSSANISSTFTVPALVAGAYIQAVPQDPTYTLTASGYIYNPVTAIANGSTTYSLRACLENTNEATVNAVTSVAAATCPSQRSYTITNP